MDDSRVGAASGAGGQRMLHVSRAMPLVSSSRLLRRFKLFLRCGGGGVASPLLLFVQLFETDEELAVTTGSDDFNLWFWL